MQPSNWFYSQIKKSDLEIVKKTLKDFNGSLLPLSLLRHHPFTSKSSLTSITSRSCFVEII